MARNISTEELANIQSGIYAHNWFILFEFPSGLYGFHLGSGAYELSGITYYGGGSVLTIEQMDTSLDLSASPITIKLRSVPEVGLSPDVLASVDDENYKNAPVSMTLVYFNTETGAPAIVETWWRGKVDKIPLHEDPGGESYLLAHLEPMSLDHSRLGFRVRSDADQKMIDPDDRFYEHAALIQHEDLPYGRKNERKR